MLLVPSSTSSVRREAHERQLAIRVGVRAASPYYSSPRLDVADLDHLAGVHRVPISIRGRGKCVAVVIPSWYAAPIAEDR